MQPARCLRRLQISDHHARLARPGPQAARAVHCKAGRTSVRQVSSPSRESPDARGAQGPQPTTGRRRPDPARMNYTVTSGRRREDGDDDGAYSPPPPPQGRGQGAAAPAGFFNGLQQVPAWGMGGMPAPLPDAAAAMAMASPAFWNPMVATASLPPPDPSSMLGGPTPAVLSASMAPGAPSRASLPRRAPARAPPRKDPARPPRGSAPRGAWDARDEITEPSAESGGPAEPTAAYALRASFTPIRLPAPRPILVVIDLNGTLLYRPNRKSPSRFVERPHARRFLEYCADTFWVVIWSSARPDNVERMCAQLLDPARLRRVVAVWGRDRFGLTRADYGKRVWCYKRLARLWGDPAVAASHPEYAAGGRWGQGNTVLVDDSVQKARSEPHNLVRIPEFAGDPGEDAGVLPRVHDYLNELCYQSDVSTYIRAHPFHEGGERAEEEVNHG